jgi:hypothetical protein
MRTNTGSEETLELISQAPLGNDEANAAERALAAAEAQHAVAVAAADVVLAAAKTRHATVLAAIRYVWLLNHRCSVQHFRSKC